ncbi:MAG: SRPBCC family protein [Planctomycetota bacterium]
MASINLSEWVGAPVERCFLLATDLPNAAQHIDGIESIELLTDGPVGVGTRWRETRTMMGRSATEELEVTAFHPPGDPAAGEIAPGQISPGGGVAGGASYTAECESCGCHFASTMRFTPEGDGTRVELTLATRPLSLLAKLMAPASGLMMGSAKKALQQDLANLKQAAEAVS